MGVAVQDGGRQPSVAEGFTLLEVLLVIGIIALLAAFVVPQFMGTQEGVKIDLARSLVSNGGVVGKQIQIYRMHVGSFPQELKYLTEKPDDEEQAAKWRGPYIEDPEKLKDPWNHALFYKCPGDVNESTYDLYSAGPDGEEGTDDDIANYMVGEVVRRPSS